jgi:flavin reductase (DIM6/NTAB) family NADH-FMN oxidoreductase RutF
MISESIIIIPISTSITSNIDNIGVQNDIAIATFFWSVSLKPPLKR